MLFFHFPSHFFISKYFYLLWSINIQIRKITITPFLLYGDLHLCFISFSVDSAEFKANNVRRFKARKKETKTEKSFLLMKFLFFISSHRHSHSFLYVSKSTWNFSLWKVSLGPFKALFAGLLEIMDVGNLMRKTKRLNEGGENSKFAHNIFSWAVEWVYGVCKCVKASNLSF